ncbi:hypothetical protein [Spongiimicrobium sp. 3-5]
MKTITILLFAFYAMMFFGKTENTGDSVINTTQIVHTAKMIKNLKGKL